MIEVNSASVAYDGVTVLRGCSISVSQGELVALVGDNGCGKSTLGRVMCASQLVDEGGVVVDGHDPSVSELERLRVRSLVGRVSQDPADQIVSSVVYDEVAFGPRNQGLSEDEVDDRVAYALEAVGMPGMRDALCAECSGGELQRIAFAGILAMRPRYMVLDEVTAQLDPAARASMRALMRDLVDEHRIGIVLITHDPLEVDLADRIVTLDGVAGADVARSSDGPDGACRVDACSGADVDVLDAPAVGGPKQGTCVLELADVSIARGDRAVLFGVSLRVFAGDAVLLTGPSGAGKSTCAAIAAGLLEPDEGTVSWCDTPGMRPVGFALQQPESQFFLDTVFDEIAYAPRNSGLDEQEVAEAVRWASSVVGLSPELFERSPFELSGGQARRVALASIVSMRAAAYVFDEPTAALDARGRSDVHALVRRLAACGCAVLVISHDVDEWRAVVSREVTLRDGTLVEVGQRASAAPVAADGPARELRPHKAGDGLDAARPDHAPNHEPQAPRTASGGPLRYIPATPLARIDARVKIVTLMVATIGVLSASSAPVLGCWFAVLGACFMGSGMRAGTVASGLRPVAVILTFTLVANAVSCTGPAGGGVAAPSFDAAGALRGLVAVARIVVLVGLSISVAVSTTSTEVSDACVRLLRPLGRFGVPVGALGTVLAVALRFIPLVTDELYRIRLAQRARGATFDEGSLFERIGVWASVLTPLMIGLFRRADRLAEAMSGRCYDAASAGRPPAPRTLRVRDWVALVGSFAVMTAICVLGIL